VPRGPRFIAVLIAVLALLHGVPWWVLVAAPGWPTAVTVVGSAFFLLAAVSFPLAMMRGHGRHHADRLAVAADAWLGVIWQFFVWSVLGGIVGLVLTVSGVNGAGRAVAAVVLVIALGLLVVGFQRAMRVPPARELDVTLPRLRSGLDGTRLVVVADTHFGPINREGWSRRTVAAITALKPDILAHVGDLADGSVDQRRAQVAPLASAPASLARVYITGNHEYFSGAAEWIDHMTELGWDVLHNKHIVVERGGDRLIIAGIDDLTAASSGQPGQGADIAAALDGVDPTLPVLLLAHQPKQVSTSIAAGVDLQIAGHTHGGQMWPFHLLVRLDQKYLHGLSQHGDRTQLYVSRGAGFWGPPFRIFAPNELSVLTLRSPVVAG